MAKIIVHLTTRARMPGIPSPKDYPFRLELIDKLKAQGHYLVQVGSAADAVLPGIDEAVLGRPLPEVEQLVKNADLFISIDSLLPHMANYLGKRGVVLWGRGDYRVFGYMHNINLIASENNIRPDRFGFWDNIVVTPDMFVSPDAVVASVRILLK